MKQKDEKISQGDNFIKITGFFPNMANEFNIIIEKDGDGFLTAEVIELPGCHTQAKNYDQLIERIKEAILYT